MARSNCYSWTQSACWRGIRWLSWGFSAVEGVSRWDAKQDICIELLALPSTVCMVEKTGHKANVPQYVPSLCFAMSMPPKSFSFLPALFYFASRTHTLYWHISNPAHSAPNSIKFCCYTGKKNWDCLAQLVPFKNILLPAFLVLRKTFLEIIILDWAK